MERLDHQAAFTIVVLYYPIPGLVKVDSGVPSVLDRTSYITMLRLIALYCVVLYCIALCFIHYLICIQHNAMQCNTAQHNTMQCNTAQHNTMQSNAAW